jgi:hypothetical protein
VIQSKASDFYTTEKVAQIWATFSVHPGINKSSCYLLESSSWMNGKGSPYLGYLFARKHAVWAEK